MALINILRFRDVLVRSQAAQDAPALEVSVGLEQEMDETLRDFVSQSDANSSFALLRADNEAFRAEIRLLFAEQEARHQQQLNRLAATMLSGAALIAAIASILVVAFG